MVLAPLFFELPQMSLPIPAAYRPCVGIMLINPAGLVWVGHRFDEPNDEGSGEWWQMPQGGIDADEDPLKAAFRELEEETGIRSVELLAEAPDWFTYDLPDHLIGVAFGGRWRGQRQKWFALRFTGDESEINLTPPGHTAEFDAWKWVPAAELVPAIVPFKRSVYAQVAAAFAHLTK
jgi:putative (di)nucleoside polyphosphate hydrolase